MRSGELHVLMGTNGLHLVSSKVMVVAEKFKQRWKNLFELYLQDTIMLTLFFYLWRHRKVKQGQAVPVDNQRFVT